MNAKNMSRRLALVAAILSVFMLLTLTAFAEDTAVATEAATEAVTEAATEVATEATTGEADTTATTDATTEAATEAATTATTDAAEDNTEAKTRGIINLIVGGVLLIALIALLIVFRNKIPGWFKAVKSECGKIVWCPKDKLKRNSFVVLVTIIVIALLIGLLDFAFANGIRLLGKLF